MHLPFSECLTWVIIISICITGCFSIIGGEPSKSYPFFVNVQVSQEPCGGTIISPNAVLTSARCLYQNAKQRFAYPREIEIGKNSQWFSCERYITHPNFVPNLYAPFDLAVLKVSECFHLERLGNALLRPCRNNDVIQIGYALGMGLTQKRSTRFNKEVMEAKLYRYRPCRELFLEDGLLIDNTQRVCFVNNQLGVDKGVLRGDFGGPLVHKSGDMLEPPCLNGVASFSVKTNITKTLISVFTETSHFEFFLQNAVAEFWSPCEEATHFQPSRPRLFGY